METMDEDVRKLEEYVITTNYFSNIADIRRLVSIFNNDKSDDELYPFNLHTIVTTKCSGINNDTLYCDTKPNQIHHLKS